MKTSNITALIALPLLLPLQFSCTPATGTTSPAPKTGNGNALTSSQPAVSNHLNMARPMYIASAGEGGVVTCGLGPASPSNNTE